MKTILKNKSVLIITLENSKLCFTEDK